MKLMALQLAMKLPTSTRILEVVVVVQAYNVETRLATTCLKSPHHPVLLLAIYLLQCLLLISLDRDLLKTQRFLPVGSELFNTVYKIIIVKAMFYCFSLDGTNTFVDIKFSSIKRSIVCYFIDGNQQGIQKECNVILTYGVNCGLFLDCDNTNDHCKFYSGVNNTDTIQTTPPIQIIDGVTEYCFSVKASNVNGTLGQTVVEGTLNLISICNRESISGEYNNKI